jgi:hypothetical protein
MKLKELKAEKCLERLLFNKIVTIGYVLCLTSSFADVSSFLMVTEWEVPYFLLHKPDPLVSVQVHRISCRRGQFFRTGFKIQFQLTMVQGWLTMIKWLLFLGTPHLYVTDSFRQHLNTSRLPAVEFLIRMIVLYYQITYKCLYNILWRVMIWKLLGLSPLITASQWTLKNHSTLFSCEPSVSQKHGKLPA